MKFSAIIVAATSAASLTAAAPIDSSWYTWALDKGQSVFGTHNREEEEPILSYPKGAGPVLKPLVSSEALQALVSEGSLRIGANKLYQAATYSTGMYGHPTRIIGSPGHYVTLRQIEAKLSSAGSYFNVTRQYFNAVRGVVFHYGLSVGGVKIVEAAPFDLTPPTPKKKWVAAPLVLVKNQGCDASDFPAAANGSIVLIERGLCAFGDKSELAGQAGAVAAVIYNNIPGDGVFSGTLGSPLPDQIATLGVSYETGTSWADKLSLNISLSASALMDSFVKNVTTYNVIAETRDGDPDNVVMLSAHSDSVQYPGINDDGSGTISLVDVAMGLSKFSVNNTVRFAWFAGEEEGLLGSDYYVAQLSPEENIKIRVAMDYDMMASPNYAYQVYDANNDVNPNGSGNLKQLYIDFYTSQGQNHTLIPFDGRSDYDAFIKNGIPAGGVAAGAEGIKTPEEAEMFGGTAGLPYDSCYHQLCDDTTNLNYEAWVLNTKLIAHSVATYARSFEGFPLRANATFATSSKEPGFKYHGSKLVY